MNTAIIFNTFHRIYTRPLVAVLLIAHFTFLIIIGGLETYGDLNFQYWEGRAFLWLAYLWLLGAGLIGKDSSDGVLPLLFSRPVSRETYILSRWAGLLLACIAFLGAETLLALLFHLHAHADVDWRSFGSGFVAVVWMLILNASLLTFLSSFMPSQGDIGIYLCAWLAVLVSSNFTHDHALRDELLKWVSYALLPGTALFNHAEIADERMLMVLSTAEGMLLLFFAVKIMQRRQISYISGN